MRYITFDIETSNTFSDAGSNDPADLDIAVVCLHDSDTNTYHAFEQEEFEGMWHFFKEADALITFNGDHFDIPLLNKYAPFDIATKKSIDLLVTVKEALKRRIKLDTIAEATLGLNKIADGLQSIVWWREGKKDKVKEYCIEDVRITKEVYEYARKTHTLKYKDKINGNIETFAVDTSPWDNKEEIVAQTSTLF